MRSDSKGCGGQGGDGKYCRIVGTAVRLEEREKGTAAWETR